MYVVRIQHLHLHSYPGVKVSGGTTGRHKLPNTVQACSHLYHAHMSYTYWLVFMF